MYSFNLVGCPWTKIILDSKESLTTIPESRSAQNSRVSNTYCNRQPLENYLIFLLYFEFLEDERQYHDSGKHQFYGFGFWLGSSLRNRFFKYLFFWCIFSRRVRLFTFYWQLGRIWEGYKKYASDIPAAQAQWRKHLSSQCHHGLAWLASAPPSTSLFLSLDFSPGIREYIRMFHGLNPTPFFHRIIVTVESILTAAVFYRGEAG